MKVELEIGVEIPEGWEPVAVRVPEDGERYLFVSRVNGSRAIEACGVKYPRIILRKIKPVRRVFELLKSDRVYARVGDLVSVRLDSPMDKIPFDPKPDDNFFIWREVTDEAEDN